MNIKSEDLMQLLGKATTNNEIQELFKQLGVIKPTPCPYEEGYAYLGDSENLGYELIFKDEVFVNDSKYADIGDGELIFSSFIIEKLEKNRVIPPYDIDFGDSYEAIVNKIGRVADKTGELLNKKMWQLKVDNTILMLSCSFKSDDSLSSDSYLNCYKIQCSFHYGQFEWIDTV